MRREEAAGVTQLAGDLAGGLTERIHETHRAIARRAFAGVGPAAAPVAAVHDAIASVSYGAAARGFRLGGRAVGRAVASGLLPAPGSNELTRSTRGRRAVALLNGAVGDRLEASGSALHLGMAIHAGGRSVAVEPDAIAGAFPGAAPRIAVLVHGLGASEAVWAARGPADGIDVRLRAAGITPVTVRYNSGRALERSGAALAELLDELRDAWPVEAQELILIGHDLGGLVCHRAVEQGMAVPTSVVCLGAPHLGLGAERLLDRLSSALERLPETRALGRTLAMRSAGLKDGGAADAPRLDPRIRYLFVSGNVVPDARHPAAGWFGDLVVSRASAWAQPDGEGVRLPLDSYREIGGVGHYALPAHPAVHDQVLAWLTRPALPAAPAALPRADSGPLVEAELRRGEAGRQRP